MITMKDIQTNLVGAIETALFMPRGAARFSTTKSAMKRSFLVPVLCLPLTIAMILLAHPGENLNAASMQVLTTIYALRLAIYLGGFFAFSYIMARTLDKMEEFNSFIVANNWLSAPIALLTLIPTIMAITGLYAFADIYTLIVMLTLYSCACTAMLAMHVLRMPCELAIFVAVAGMAIHHNALGFVKWAAVNTLQFLA